MAFLITSLSAVVDSLIAADSDVLSQLARYRIVQAAVARYSGDKPDEDTLNVTGAASRYYAIAANLTLWQEGLSRVTAIQYPAPTVASNETPVYLDADNWRDDYWQTVTSTQTRYLYLPNHSPAATETMRITYTCPWAWTASTTTVAVTQAAHGFAVSDYIYQDPTAWAKAGDIREASHKITVKDTNTFTAAVLEADVPAADFFAICNLAAGICCEAIAAKFSRTTDSTIAADSVSHVSRAGEHAKRAQEFIKFYERHMGLDKEADVPAAGTFVEVGWDLKDYLTLR